MRKFFIMIFYLLVSSLLYAESDICLNEDIGKLPTYNGGRVKPTIVWANMVLKNLEISSTTSQVICKLSHGDRSALKNLKLDGEAVGKPDPRKARLDVIEKGVKLRNELQSRGI